MTRRGFDMHQQSHWERLACSPDPSVPMWLRVTFMAYALHRQNGHAELGVGKLRELLVIGVERDQQAGWVVTRQAHRSTLSSAVREAISNGTLHPDSTVRCLRPTPQDVEGGKLGKPHDPCQTCSEREARRKEKLACQAKESAQKADSFAPQASTVGLAGKGIAQSRRSAARASLSLSTDPDPAPAPCDRCGFADCRCTTRTHTKEKSA
jgi:hypothetical protein